MDNLPEFPKFRNIRLNDKIWYDATFATFPPYADFSFGNLAVWLNIYEDLEISQLNNNIVFRFTNVFMKNQKLYTVLGKHQIYRTFTTIFELQRRTKEPQQLFGVSELTFQESGSLAKDKFNWIHDRGNDEYIIDSESLAKLEGSSLRKIRREVRTFIKLDGDTTLIKEVELNERSIGELVNGLHTWDKAYSSNDLSRQESVVITRTFLMSKELDYKAIALYINGKLEGFVLFQILPHKNVIVLNHIKVSYHYRYMFDFLLYATASRLLERGVLYINFEQDLNIQGLRTHKLSLKPKYMLKKYTVIPKTYSLERSKYKHL